MWDTNSGPPSVVMVEGIPYVEKVSVSTVASPVALSRLVQLLATLSTGPRGPGNLSAALKKSLSCSLNFLRFNSLEQ